MKGKQPKTLPLFGVQTGEALAACGRDTYKRLLSLNRCPRKECGGKLHLSVHGFGLHKEVFIQCVSCGVRMIVTNPHSFLIHREDSGKQ
jgi:hypothetical protein